MSDETPREEVAHSASEQPNEEPNEQPRYELTDYDLASLRYDATQAEERGVPPELDSLVVTWVPRLVDEVERLRGDLDQACEERDQAHDDDARLRRERDEEHTEAERLRGEVQRLQRALYAAWDMGMDARDQARTDETPSADELTQRLDRLAEQMDRDRECIAALERDLRAVRQLTADAAASHGAALERIAALEDATDLGPDSTGEPRTVAQVIEGLITAIEHGLRPAHQALATRLDDLKRREAGR